MDTSIDIIPLFADVVVVLTGQRDDHLGRSALVVQALERAGRFAAAEAFAALAIDCTDEADLETLIRSTVTMI